MSASVPSTPPSSPPLVEPLLRSATAPPPSPGLWEVTTIAAPPSPSKPTVALAPLAPAGLSVADDGLTFEEAQCVYPCAAAVFVGNLPNTWSHQVLAQAISVHFGRYGNCWIRVNRTVTFRNGSRLEKPHAHVQFEYPSNAQAAINESGTIYLTDRNTGIARPTRVSKLDANRSI